VTHQRLVAGVLPAYLAQKSAQREGAELLIGEGNASDRGIHRHLTHPLIPLKNSDP
jgi:hypothetical protein